MRTFLIIFLLTHSINAKIHLVLTAALVNDYYEVRKQQYINSFKILTKHGIENPYIIEAVNKKGPTFLDDYSNNVFYASTNEPNLKNIGINECHTLLEGLLHFNFDPNDLIIKLTGRYIFVSDAFFQCIRNNPGYDVYVKHFPNHKDSTFSACFCMRNKHLIKMLTSLNYKEMENKNIYLELAIGRYIKQNKNILKIFYTNDLGVKMFTLGSTTAPNTGDHSLIF